MGENLERPMTCWGVLLLITLTGCASGNNTRGPSGAETPDPLEASAEAQVLHDQCEEILGGFLSELQELDSRLSVGMAFDEYGERVADVRVAYDQIPFDEMDSRCVRASGIPAEKALNQYVNAYNTWNECIGDFDCDTDSIEPDLQREWADATDLIAQAESGLDRLAIP